eukprot:COSAG02_NODE_10858_length_1844_cov_1.455899_2_plen_160_part_00
MATVPWDRHGHYNVNNTAYYVSFARRYRLERPRRLQGGGGPRGHFDGDFDECMDPKRQWTKTLVHNTLVDALVRFVKDCGMVDVRYEFKYWDPAERGRMNSGARFIYGTASTTYRTSLVPYKVLISNLVSGMYEYTSAEMYRRKRETQTQYEYTSAEMY